MADKCPSIGMLSSAASNGTIDSVCVPYVPSSAPFGHVQHMSNIHEKTPMNSGAQISTFYRCLLRVRGQQCTDMHRFTASTLRHLVEFR